MTHLNKSSTIFYLGEQVVATDAVPSSDDAQVSDWAQEAVLAAKAKGINIDFWEKEAFPLLISRLQKLTNENSS